MKAGELVAMLRRAQSDACDNLRRRPDWSPARDLDRCECGAPIGAHACRMLADRLELVARRDVDVKVAIAAWQSAAFEARENPAHDREALVVAGDALVELLAALVPMAPH